MSDPQTYIKVVYQTDDPCSVVTKIHSHLNKERLDYLKSLGTVNIYECTKDDSLCEIIIREL